MNKVLITDKTSDINNHLKNKDTVIILFHANWCGACQQFVPVWDEVCGNISKTDNDITIGKVESEHFDEIGINDINAFPTFRAYQNGNMVDERVGGVPPQELKAFLVKYLKNNKTKTKTKKNKMKNKKSTRSKTKKNKQNGGRICKDGTDSIKEGEAFSRGCEEDRMGDGPLRTTSRYALYVEQIEVKCDDIDNENIKLHIDTIINEFTNHVDVVKIVTDNKDKDNKEINNLLKTEIWNNKITDIFNYGKLLNSIWALAHEMQNVNRNKLEGTLSCITKDDDNIINKHELIKGIIYLYIGLGKLTRFKHLFNWQGTEKRNVKGINFKQYLGTGTDNNSNFDYYFKEVDHWNPPDPPKIPKTSKTSNRIWQYLTRFKPKIFSGTSKKNGEYIGFDWKKIIESKEGGRKRKRKTRKRKRNKRKKRKSRRRRRR